MVWKIGLTYYTVTLKGDNKEYTEEKSGHTKYVRIPRISEVKAELILSQESFAGDADSRNARAFFRNFGEVGVLSHQGHVVGFVELFDNNQHFKPVLQVFPEQCGRCLNLFDTFERALAFAKNEMEKDAKKSIKSIEEEHTKALELLDEQYGVS
jgi:hypothetical protein